MLLRIRGANNVLVIIEHGKDVFWAELDVGVDEEHVVCIAFCQKLVDQAIPAPVDKAFVHHKGVFKPNSEPEALSLKSEKARNIHCVAKPAIHRGCNHDALTL